MKDVYHWLYTDKIERPTVVIDLINKNSGLFKWFDINTRYTLDGIDFESGRRKNLIMVMRILKKNSLLMNKINDEQFNILHV
jgi:hypothetical protein